jgi:hypothetical protein
MRQIQVYHETRERLRVIKDDMKVSYDELINLALDALGNKS